MARFSANIARSWSKNTSYTGAAQPRWVMRLPSYDQKQIRRIERRAGMRATRRALPRIRQGKMVAGAEELLRQCIRVRLGALSRRAERRRPQALPGSHRKARFHLLH